MANLNPTQQEVAPKIPEFREAFKTKNADHIKNGDYDVRDVERLNKDDIWAGCFLRTLKARGDPTKAAEVAHESLKFRKEIGVLDVDPAKLPTDITERNAIYYKGADVNGHPILYVNVKENVSKAEHQHALKQYVAWYFEKHQKENPEQMCVVLMDMSGASTSNVGIDITKYIITCFTTYFPSFLAYMINYDMPMLLSATWSIISAFLSSEQKQKLLMVKKGDITKYIPEQHLWPHMVKK
jgi:hypothetical protein